MRHGRPAASAALSTTLKYLDSPYHRYADGTDLAGLPLTSLVDLLAVVVTTAGTGVRAVDVDALSPLDVAGNAVLLYTGGDAGWGTPPYAVEAPYLTEAGARWLIEHDARLMGIHAVNIDRIDGTKERPAHTHLPAAGTRSAPTRRYPGRRRSARRPSSARDGCV